MKINRIILGSLLVVCAAGCSSPKDSNPIPVQNESYVWKSVRIVGGGFVDGLVFHPQARDVRYARTDMGGAYRWDKSLGRWEPMLDWISYDDNNLMGVESIAVDPSDPQTVYLSCGTYTRAANGAVLISEDGGRRFTRVDMPFAMGGNENGRGNGERMAVDPLNSHVVYLGTRQDGLWRSLDRGRSWQRVHEFPDGKEETDISVPPMRRSRGSGIIFILFDPSGGDAAGCRTIYAGVSWMNRPNLFVSHDAGDTWTAVAGQPQAYRPTHGIFSGEDIYLTYGTDPGPMPMQDGAVWKFHTSTAEWEDITPVKTDSAQGLRFGYAAVSVDASNPLHLIVSTFGRPVEGQYTEDDIFRSTDGGKSWTSVFSHSVEMDYSRAPYTKFTPLHWMFDIEIDPFDPNHALFTTGYGGWETFNLHDAGRDDTPVRWQIMSTGIEETVPLELYSPSKGAHIISAIGDYGGFTHFDLDNPPPTGPHADPYFANTNGVTGAEENPSLIVRVGAVSAHHPEGKPLSYSEDGGISWNMPRSLPGEPGNRVSNGHIAVSADGKTWIWTPGRMNVYRTTNKGDSWEAGEGIPAGIRVVADRVNSRRFYGLDIRSGVVYESRDGGISFSADSLLSPVSPPFGNRGDSRGGQDRLYTVPGREGEYWIAAYDGLYLRRPGEPLRKFDKVRRIFAFGFGKGITEEYPALYLIGIVNGEYGFFRSDDVAGSWVRINDNEHQYGLVLHISGDPKLYGRVYVGTHGRGLLYGDPAK